MMEKRDKRRARVGRSDAARMIPGGVASHIAARLGQREAEQRAGREPHTTYC